MTGSPLTPPQVRAIARVYTGTSKNVARLAKLYRVKPGTIVRAARRGGNKRAAVKFEREFWTTKDFRLVREKYADMRTDDLAALIGKKVTRVYQVAARLGLHKSRAYLDSAEPHKNKVANKGCFKKGQVPPNKGKKMPPGWAPGRMRETQFKKGERSGKAAEHYMPIGAERDVEGVLYVKVADVPNVAYTVNWLAVHDLIWMRERGPIPASHFVEFVDRNKRNFDLANLRLCSRAENARRNRLHQWPKELQHVIVMRNVLERAIRERREAQ